MIEPSTLAAVTARYDPSVTLGALLVFLGQIIAFILLIWRISAWKATTDQILRTGEARDATLATSVEALNMALADHLRGHPLPGDLARRDDIAHLQREIDKVRRTNGA